MNPAPERSTCAACGSENSPSNRFCGACGNPLEPEGPLLRAQIRRVLQTELKDQNLVEIEITQAIASRLSVWVKLFGFFVAIPLTAFAFILAFFGWRTFSDVEKTASQVGADVQKAQTQAKDLSKQSEQLNEQFKKLVNDAQRYSTLDERVQKLQESVRQIQNNFTLGAKLPDGTLQRLDADLSRLQSCLAKAGQPAQGKFNVFIAPEDYPPMQKATVFFDSANKRALIKPSKTSDSSALLEMYMVSVLIPKGFPKPMSGQYQAVFYSLQSYFPRSCFNTQPSSDSSTQWSETGHVMDWFHSYESMLWEIRARKGSNTVDRPVLQAWSDLQPSCQDPHFASVFSAKLIALLGKSAGAQAGDVFKTGGLSLTN